MSPFASTDPALVAQLEARLEEALDRALLEGLLKYLPSGALTHAPLSLVPCPVPGEAIAGLAALTAPFNRLTLAVAAELPFLEQALGAAAREDAFVAELLRLARCGRGRQPLHLLVTRSDYFLEPAAPDRVSGALLPRQVELNTIAVSYAGLAGRVQRVHRFLLQGTPAAARLVANDPIPALAEGFAEAHRRYGQPGAAMVTVVQPGETNRLDQRWLEFAVRERGIPTARLTLAEIGREGRLKEGHLHLRGQAVAIAYLRAGYAPEDLRHPDALRGRELIERSAAIVVPTVAVQLAGTKKVQQLLTDRALLRRFASEPDARALEASFAGLYALDEPIAAPGGARPAWEVACAAPERFVLKPQREGGGHNLFDRELAERLRALRPEARHAYVLMERIAPFVHEAVNVAAGVATREPSVSEIGRFGLLLAQGAEAVLNRDVGYLVRTKGEAVRESGVSAGFGHLNSLLDAG
ncbi:MAG: hypothetical protein HY423_16795 [Candidatus Lambdaproteobacteria bacterium]|nr:hypothetical protein [Candidatus Lambdaproteobacteria bacterium]